MKLQDAFAIAAAFAGLASAGCASNPPVHELRTYANEAFAREEYKRAIAFDEEILRRQPDDYAATFQKAVAQDRIGLAADAHADYSRAIELDPEAAKPRLYRANLALKTNHVDAAISDVQAVRGLRLETHEAVAALCLEGTIHQKKGDWAGALKTYRRAIAAGRSDPDPATQKHTRDALHNASESSYRLGGFDEAAALYTEHVAAKARADEPVTEDDHYTLGVLHYLRGDFERSRAAFGRVSAARKRQAAKLLNDEGFFARETAAVVK